MNKIMSGVMALFFALSLSLMGCDTSCKRACKKLVNECESAPEDFGVDQCELECELFQTQIDDDPSREAESIAFQENLNCIQDAECIDLEDPDSPACYDPEAYPF